jgi:hypothetical protein
MAAESTGQFKCLMVLLHKFEKDHIPARAIFIATTCEEPLE